MARLGLVYGLEGRPVTAGLRQVRARPVVQ